MTLAALGAVIAALLSAFSLPGGSSRLDEWFNLLRGGMSAHAVEAVLGTPVPRDPSADRHCVATFDDVDQPPLSEGKFDSAYWYDGTQRRVRVRYRDSKL